jgi:hypothetical protein
MYDKSTIKYVEVSYIISFKTGSVQEFRRGREGMTLGKRKEGGEWKNG